MNGSLGKNLIGTFHQPLAVIADTSILKTLPRRELRAGFAEVIKYGLIKDKSFFIWLEDNFEKILNLNDISLNKVIITSCSIKSDIIQDDEKEIGKRALLNLGHTFGHAIEAFNKYKNITHGEAVTIGMVIATKISFHEGYIKNYQLDNVINLIDSLGLNSDYKKYKYKDLKQFILNDKKVSQGKLNLILINSSGKAFKTDKFTQQNLRKAFI